MSPILRQIEVVREAVQPAFREFVEPTRRLQPHISPWRMVVGAVRFGAACPVLALLELEEGRVVFLFFPPVRVGTVVLMDAAFRV